MPDPAVTLVFGMAAIVLGAVISGLTGFGFALVTVPLLIIVLPPKVVVPIVALLSISSHFVILGGTLRWIQIRRIALLSLAGVIGVQLGTYLLLILDAKTLKTLIGAVTSVSALAIMLGFKRTIRNERLASLPVGLASGILSGSTGMGGPPVVLFFSNQGVDKHVFRANLNLFFIVLTGAALPAQLLAGLLTHQVVTYAAWFLPALFLGTLLGMRLAHHVDEAAFRTITLVIITATGLSAIASGLGIL